MHLPLTPERTRHRPKFRLLQFFQPATAWLLIIGFALFSAAAILAGAGSIFRYIFPVGSAAIALFLYIRYPILYVGFTWWLWILTPLVTRLTDYYSSWDPRRVMMVTPFLVTLIPLVTLLKQAPKLIQRGAAPFFLAGCALVYGSVVGLINNSAFGVARNLLDWLSPLVFGLYFFVNWRSYPQYRQNLQRVFLWGVLITGVYGIYQYMVAPGWDRFWLEQTGIVSMGIPEPRGIRLWSTMHSTGPFSVFITAGLLLLFSETSPLALPAIIAGYLSFMLTLARTAWGSWFVGVMLLFSSLKSRLQMRFIFLLIMVVVSVIFLASLPQFSESVGGRFETLADLSSDNSFLVRMRIYRQGLDEALANVVGSGIGGVWGFQDGQAKQIVIDSGIIDTLMTLGWVGTVPYFSGLFLAFYRVISSPYASSDAFLSTARAISISYCFQLLMGTAVAGLSGILIWSFLAVSMAGDKYYKNMKYKSNHDISSRSLKKVRLI